MKDFIKANIKAARYHAGMGDVERNREQERFLEDKATVMVATSAFGMGIDKSNIRYVVHYQHTKKYGELLPGSRSCRTGWT